MQYLCFLPLVLLLACAFGCADVHRIESRMPPPPKFDSISVTSLGKNDSIEVEGLKAYVSRYGWDGWLAGLEDSRLVQEAIKELSSDEENQVITSTQDDMEGYDLRVKDVFYFYYLRQSWADKTLVWTPVATWEERDSVIAKAIANVKKEMVQINECCFLK